MTATTARERRRAATTAEILEAAWALCRENGLASLSLRDLAARVGMRAPSLYSYFESKHAIYDAMYRQGYEDLAAEMRRLGDDQPVTRARIKAATRIWFEFCIADPARYQLLFQRTIPGFEPSAESYTVAIGYLAEMGEEFAAAGVNDPAHLDLFTALTTGLTSQQLSNDPGGDRWSRLLDDAIDMFLDHVGALPTDQAT